MENQEQKARQGGEGCGCGGPGRGRMKGQGSPMAMMQKMMAGMGRGEGAAPMQQMMATCQEMLGAIRQTNALAVFGTPELRSLFAEWLQALERKAEAALADGEKDAAALAGALGITQESARYVLARLAASGRATLVGRCRV